LKINWLQVVSLLNPDKISLSHKTNANKDSPLKIKFSSNFSTMKSKSVRLSISLFFLFFTLALSAQILVNEYSCANLDQYEDNYQKNEDWIELYNPTDAAVSLNGWHMSDDAKEATKWAFPASASIPAKGFLSVWASGRNQSAAATGHFHTNFRLTQTKSKPEHIILTNPAGSIAQNVEVEKTQMRQSRGRLTDGAAQWRIFTKPSRKTTNNGSAAFLTFAARPDMSTEGGFFQDSVIVAISTNEPNSKLYYTLDGSEPSDSTGLLYPGPLTLNKTTVLKALAVSNNPLILPSFVQFNTYFINDKPSLMVVSVGSQDVIELANGNKLLRPIGSLELFGIDGDRKTRSYGDLNSHGQDSWANDQRSLDWVTRDQMGYSNALKEKIFSNSDRNEYQRIILRAAGDDNYPAAHHAENEGSAHIRDAYIHNLADRGGLHLDVRRGEKAIVYLNGEYWGVYDLRENPDEHDFTDYYYGQGEYEIQYLETWGNTWAEYGGPQALNQWKILYNYINSATNNMADPAKYQYVTDRYDVNSLVDYVIVNSFTVCSDWLNYNTGWWRGLNPDGGHQKWGYILWDNDATFGHYINYTGIPNTEADALPCDVETLTGTTWSDPEGHIKILKKLRKNPTFDQYYITRQADLLNTTFSCETMLNTLDAIVATIGPEMDRHAQRWDGTYDEWQHNVQRLRNFVALRCEELNNGMIECYDLTGPYPAVVQVEPPGAGTLQVNSLYHKQFPVVTTYFGGVATKLTAFPDTTAKYVFSHWKANKHSFGADSLSSTALLQLTQADTLTAVFKKQTSSTQPDLEDTAAEMVAFPSLFDQEVNVYYVLPIASQVSIRLFDVTGNEVADLDHSNAAAGAHTQRFSFGKQLPAGMYFLKFESNYGSKTVKLVRTAQ